MSQLPLPAHALTWYHDITRTVRHSPQLLQTGANSAEAKDLALRSTAQYEAYHSGLEQFPATNNPSINHKF
jgi:hypothetical protein